MKVRWHNLLGFPLAVFGLVSGLVMRDHISAFLSAAKYPRSAYYPPGQVVLGAVSLMLVILSIVAIIKILFCPPRTP